MGFAQCPWSPPASWRHAEEGPEGHPSDPGAFAGTWFLVWGPGLAVGVQWDLTYDGALGSRHFRF